MVTRIRSATRDAVVFPFPFAFLAIGHTAGKTPLLDVLQTGVIIWELSVEIVYCVTQVLRNGLSAVHRSLPA